MRWPVLCRKRRSSCTNPPPGAGESSLYIRRVRPHRWCLENHLPNPPLRHPCPHRGRGRLRWTPLVDRHYRNSSSVTPALRFRIQEPAPPCLERGPEAGDTRSIDTVTDILRSGMHNPMGPLPPDRRPRSGFGASPPQNGSVTNAVEERMSPSPAVFRMFLEMIVGTTITK